MTGYEPERFHVPGPTLPQAAFMAGQDMVQREIHQDRTNRECAETITSSIPATPSANLLTTTQVSFSGQKPGGLTSFKQRSIQRQTGYFISAFLAFLLQVTRTSYSSCLGIGRIEVERIKEESALKRIN